MDPRGLFGEDWAGCVEEFFALLQLHLVFAPQLLAASSGVAAQALGLACVCLRQCSEREPLRAALRAVQGLFLPTSFKATHSSSSNSSSSINSSSNGGQQPEEVLLLQSCSLGSQVVFLLLRVLASGGGDLLAPNLADSLQAVLTGCFTHSSPLMAQCRAWFLSALPAAFPRIAACERVASALLRLGERRDRRLRSLVQDLAKIAAGELTEDALLAYDEDP